MRKRRIIKSASGHAKALEMMNRNKGSELALCQTCGLVEETVDVGNKLVVCSSCVQKQVAPPPAPKPPLTLEEKTLRADRKLEKAKRRVAKELGVIIPPKDLGFARGWHRRKVFVTTIDEHAKETAPQYFSYGKEITKAEYDTLLTEEANKEVSKLASTTGFGRGWHLKKEFIAPDGSTYSFGKKAE